MKFIHVICLAIGIFNLIAATITNNTPQAILGALICFFSALNLRGI